MSPNEIAALVAAEWAALSTAEVRHYTHEKYAPTTREQARRELARRGAR